MRSAFGHIRKHKNGKYRVEWSEFGQRHSKVVNTKKDATTLLAKRQLATGDTPHNVTYQQFYDSVIVDTYKHVSDRTAVEYKNA